MTRNYAAHSSRVLQVNADEVRTEELHGREHVVAEATLVREMVLKGEMLPFEEIQRTSLAWNGSPVTVTHPRDAEGGFLPASADASEFEANAVGHVFNVTSNSDERALEGEVWLDAEQSAETAEALDRDDPAGMLLDGEPVEVSTGYWYTKQDASGEYEGVQYNATQHDLQPDHLATLPNGVGECSIDDGCGAGATAAANSTHDAVAFTANCGGDGGTGDISEATLRQRLATALGLQDGEGDAGCACNDFEYDGQASAFNVDVGDAVRWESSASGSVETSDGTYRYGVVVDGLQDDDEPDGSLLVAVYEPTDDGWENRNEQNAIDTDALEVVGPDGTGSLPAISQLGGQSGTDNGGVADTGGRRLVFAAEHGDHTTMNAYDIDDIAAASGLSRETLEALDDDELAAHAETVLADANDGDGDDGDGDTTDDDDQGGNPSDDGDGPDDSDDDTDAANSLDADDIRQIVREEVNEAQQSTEEKQLIETIQKHASRDISEDELAGMSKEALEGLAQDVKPTGGVYAGRAGAAGNSGEEVEMGASLDALGDGGDD